MRVFRTRARVPALEEGAIHREGDEGQSDQSGKGDEEEADAGAALGRPVANPVLKGGVVRERDGEEGGGEKGGLNNALGPRLQAGYGEVREEVAEKEGGLEEEEGAVPDRGRAAKGGKDEAGREGFDDEEQRRGEEGGNQERRAQGHRLSVGALSPKKWTRGTGLR